MSCSPPAPRPTDARYTRSRSAAVAQHGERRLLGGQHELEEPALLVPAVAGRLRRRGTGVGGQPVELVLVGHQDAGRVGRRQEVAAERGLEGHDLRVQRAQPVLRRLVEPDARAHELRVRPVQQPRGVGLELERAGVHVGLQRRDAREQPGVQ